MKKLLYTIAFALLVIGANAQKKGPIRTKHISFRVGMDQAQKKNFTDYVDSKLMGFNIGGSYDMYWNWFGLGGDIDVMVNEKTKYLKQAELISHINGPFDYNKDWTISEKATGLTRVFAGIGPSFKLSSKNNKLSAELNLRTGITYINGGFLNYATRRTPTAPLWMDNFITRDGDADPGSTLDITKYGTFHTRGYQNEFLSTVKAQVRVNYFIKPKLGINIGGYVMRYAGSELKYNYLDWIEAQTTTPVQNYWGNNSYGNSVGVISHDVSALSSFGVNLGITYRVTDQKESNTNKYSTASVNVKDEQTGLPLQGVNVVITGADGKTYSGITDATGLVNIKVPVANNYTVNGELNGIMTNTASMNATGKTSQVSLTHNDPRFTVVGKSINLNTGKPEGEVSVSLKNNSKGSVAMKTSEKGSGSFGFQLDANSDYELVGKKDGYISNIEKVSTKGLNRSQTIYVQLELGIQEVKVGQSIELKNIYYDLNKADIRQDASVDLDRLVIFLKDNPSANVEIASHTDSRGSSDYNQKLSQDRAQNVVNYLVSKGISASRLIAKGYGESNLINACGDGSNCSEEEHQKNRRTEFKLIN